MDQIIGKDGWRAEDTPSASSGRFSEVVIARETDKLPEEARDGNELTLMRLRRLSIRLMSKNERLRYSERKLCRSNVFKFLDLHVSHPSEKVRYLALEVLCFTVPRLGTKTNSLLKSIMPKVFLCLRGEEEKDIKLKALHFLRGYFRHTKNLSNFTENFVHLGINNEDPEVRISCFFGLNIIFDQDIGNSLFAHLVVSLANQLGDRNSTEVIRIGYRALKNIHKTIGDARFFELMSSVSPEAIHIYKDIFIFEESDSFLSLNETDCTSLLSSYQMKRKCLNLDKDFGILDTSLLDQIEKTRNCERAKAVGRFTTVLKRTMWTDEDLDPHITDFLKLITSFIGDANRLIQMSGFDILKEVINRMGFVLSPHIHCIVEKLRQALTSANSKIKGKADRVLYKLMRNIHPMTIMWELLNTKNSSEKEAVLLLVKEKIRCFPYHELDMVALCSYLGRTLEDKNSNVSKYSRDCICLLLDIMRDCPTYGNKTEAVRVLLRNYKLSRQTLTEIGILGHCEDFLEGFESYSEDETTDLAMENSFLENSEPSTVSEEVITPENPYFHKPCLSDAVDSNLETDTLKSKKATHLATPSRTACSKTAKLNVKPKQDFISHLKIKKLPPCNSSVFQKRCLFQTEEGDNPFFQNGTAFDNADVSWDHNYGSMPRKHLTNFCMQPEIAHCDVDAHMCDFQDERAGGDTAAILRSNSTSNTQRHFERDVEADYVSECYEQDGVQVDVMNKDIFNFNILKVDNSQTPYDTEEVDKSECEEYRTPLSKSYLNRKKLHSKKMHNSKTASSSRNFQAASVLTNIVPMTPSSNTSSTPIAMITPLTSRTDTVPCTPATNISSYTSVFNLVSDRPVANEVPCTPVTYEVPCTPVTNEIPCTPVIYEVPSTPIMYEVPCTPVTDEVPSTPVSSKFPGTPVPNTFSIHKTPISRYKNTRGIHSKYFSEVNNGYITQNPHTVPRRHIGTNFSEQQHSDAECNATRRHKLEKFEAIVPKEEMNQNEKELSEARDVLSEMRRRYSVTDDGRRQHRDVSDDNCAHESVEEHSVSHCNEFEESETPFLPKNRQLPRTPVQKKKDLSLNVHPKSKKSKKTVSGLMKKNKLKEILETAIDGSVGVENNAELSDKLSRKSRESSSKPVGMDAGFRQNSTRHNSSSTWGGCQWRRDLDYAVRAGTCAWAEEFEKVVESMPPFSPTDAESEMKKAIEDLFGGSWTEKEDAMLKVIRLAKHHPELVYGNTSKIAVALSNEIKNVRQSVAGKAILTTGHLYEMMGKNFESKLRLVVAALLAKSGNRTLAAYYRLVIKCLAKITFASSPQKAAMAFIHEGSKLANKAARETAAQFLVILTECMGPENSMAASLSSHMLKCAAIFVLDSSALIRYCGKRMFDVLMKHADFEKMKDHQLEINTLQSLSKILDQVKIKGVQSELLPINVIQGRGITLEKYSH